jgi:hypothetical protein
VIVTNVVVSGNAVARVVLFAPGGEVASWPVRASHPDLALVDRLARLELAARRIGCHIVVHAAGTELAELLDLVGLRDLVSTDAGSHELHELQMCGQAEDLEQSGVEEVVQPDDPTV